jgi:hypothetical protein
MIITNFWDFVSKLNRATVWMITKVWKFSINNNLNWLSKPLTQILNHRWFKEYQMLSHDVEQRKRRGLIILTFFISEVGDINPNLLGSIFITILFHPFTIMVKGNMSIMMTAHYEGEVKSIAAQYIITPDSTPEDFIKHFIHFTNKDGHGESKMVLTNAYYVKVKVMTL